MPLTFHDIISNFSLSLEVDAITSQTLVLEFLDSKSDTKKLTVNAPDTTKTSTNLGMYARNLASSGTLQDDYGVVYTLDGLRRVYYEMKIHQDIWVNS